MKSRKHVVKLYHDKINMIQVNYRRDVEKRLEEKEDRENKLGSQTAKKCATRTNQVLQKCQPTCFKRFFVCFFLCHQILNHHTKFQPCTTFRSGEIHFTHISLVIVCQFTQWQV